MFEKVMPKRLLINIASEPVTSLLVYFVKYIKIKIKVTAVKSMKKMQQKIGE